ncbi:enoyl-CoA hydratase/isomerase family protein [Novosphingobium flavum]|uniref:enoyl-CoA hydratase-related protein n=1 Tax=Novosphingobium aerophilum TaxID=2839843 RepID=UPI00163AA110|nr:enoyl-CoA hydratase-related protein [Novosphingobium aerophilum]MBC2662779.1 enoyl-CoA hydratase/isomerase family protein [Novosphingobium aerophilum]
MSLVRIDRHDATAVITLDDPRRRNILSPELAQALSAAVAEANAADDVAAIVITGTAPAFCAGADLADLQAAASGDVAAVNLVYRAFLDVADSVLPTIAAVNGAAVGAGMNLALACDLRIAGESASFDTRFLKIGLHPGGGHGWMLLRAVGWAEATRMLLLDRALGAAEAARVGLVQQISPDGELMGDALALAGRAAALPRDLIVRTKASLRLAATSDHQAAFRHETEEQLRSLGEPPFEALVERMKHSIAARQP